MDAALKMRKVALMERIAVFYASQIIWKLTTESNFASRADFSTNLTFADASNRQADRHAAAKCVLSFRRLNFF